MPINEQGIVVAPVRVVDACMAIGGNLGNLNVGVICSNAEKKINKWAKFKPVTYANGPFASSPGSPGYTKDWWQAKYVNQSLENGIDGDCGLSPGVRSSQRLSFARAAAQSASARAWKYHAPTGGMVSPCRITDFNGYNHSAINPFGQLPEQMEVYVKEGNSASTVSFIVHWPEAFAIEGGLKATDIKFKGGSINDVPVDLSEWYYGVLFLESEPDKGSTVSTSGYQILTAPNPGTKIIQITNTIDNIFSYEWALPLICNKPIAWNTTQHSDEIFIALEQPKAMHIVWKYYDELVGAVATARRSTSNNNNVEWTVIFSNYTKQTVKFTEIALYSKPSMNSRERHQITTLSEKEVPPNERDPSMLYQIAGNSKEIIWTTRSIPTDTCMEVEFNAPGMSRQSRISFIMKTAPDDLDIGLIPPAIPGPASPDN